MSTEEQPKSCEPSEEEKLDLWVSETQRRLTKAKAPQLAISLLRELASLELIAASKEEYSKDLALARANKLIIEGLHFCYSK